MFRQYRPLLSPMQETYNLIAKLNGPAAKRIYQPLGHGYIRLVILHPGHRPLLECSLAAHYLTSPPKYEALSYAWGSPHKPRRILLNGHLFHVTQNLYDVLNRLRYTSIERLIWVDALAINQSDVLERSEQVSIMRNIYSTANRTLVWLGEGDENTSQIFEFSGGKDDKGRNLLKESNNGNGSSVDPRRQTNDLSELLNHPALDKNRLAYGDSDAESAGTVIKESANTYLRVTSEQFHNLSGHLFNFTKQLSLLSYWSRVWVVQEMMYSHDIVLMYGSSTLPFVKFQSFWANMLERFSTRTKGTDLQNAILIANASINMEILKLGPRPDPEKAPSLITAQDWLNYGCQRNCTDARDIVFGFYGCFVPELRRLITIDYSKSTSQVFCDMTAAIMQMQGNVDIMFKAEQHDRQLSDLPSWVPDFSGKRKHLWRRESGLDNLKSGASVYQTECVEEGKESKTTSSSYPNLHKSDRQLYTLLPGNRVLGVMAIRIGAIEEVSDGFIDLSQNYYNAFENIHTIWTHLSACRRALKVSDDALDRFILAFIPVLANDPRTDWKALARQLLSCPPSAAQLRQQRSRPSNDDFCFLITCYLHAWHSGRGMFRMKSLFTKEVRSSNAFDPEQPCYGVGTADMKPGDKVYMVLNSNETEQFYTTLAVIRPIQDQDGYTLIGRAYLHFEAGDKRINNFWNKIPKPIIIENLYIY